MPIRILREELKANWTRTRSLSIRREKKKRNRLGMEVPNSDVGLLDALILLKGTAIPQNNPDECFPEARQGVPLCAHGSFAMTRWTAFTRTSWIRASDGAVWCTKRKNKLEIVTELVGSGAAVRCFAEFPPPDTHDIKFLSVGERPGSTGSCAFIFLML